MQGFHDILEPTVPLSRHIFKAPTRFYKTGVVFLAYLNGLQDHFVMVGGQQSARSLLHLAELFRLADKARVLRDPELAARAHGQACSPCTASRDPKPMRTDGLSINLATVREQWDLREAVDACAAPRHHARSRRGATRSRRSASTRRRASSRANGLRVTGFCRGGMFPAADAAGRAAAIDDNRAPSTRRPRSAPTAWCWWSAGCRRARAISPRRAAMVATASPPCCRMRARASMPLAIEPLHPMYAADRACVNTLAQALDLCDALGDGVGVAIDIYHVWWDPELEAQIARAGAASASSRITSATGWCRPATCCSTAA